MSGIGYKRSPYNRQIHWRIILAGFLVYIGNSLFIITFRLTQAGLFSEMYCPIPPLRANVGRSPAPRIVSRSAPRTSAPIPRTREEFYEHPGNQVGRAGIQGVWEYSRFALVEHDDLLHRERRRRAGHRAYGFHGLERVHHALEITKTMGIRRRPLRRFSGLDPGAQLQ